MMDLFVAKIVAALLLPPMNVVLFLLLALYFRKRNAGVATALLLIGLGLLVIPSMPLVSDRLCQRVEVYPPASEQVLRESDAEAIVVLAGGWRRAPEYGHTTVNAFSLERVAYGAWLHRRSGLPVAVTGGKVFGTEEVSEGRLMAGVLANEFGVQARWVETDSRNTAENAENTVELLEKSGVGRILLVTHAFHMARAVPLFESLGMIVIPAPMGFCSDTKLHFRVGDLLPSAKALLRSYLALHELLGQAWYALRYG